MTKKIQPKQSDKLDKKQATGKSAAGKSASRKTQKIYSDARLKSDVHTLHA
jgi:hypothetical protein